MARLELEIESDNDLRQVLDRISFVNSILSWGWSFHFDRLNVRCWSLWVMFDRPDVETGVIGRGRSRSELVYLGASESSVMKTCWLLIELTTRHELMEGFRYEGVKVFDPHNTIGDLQTKEPR